MSLSRRDFGKLAAGGGAAAMLTQLGLSASVAQTTSSYRAMVAISLGGGCDGWNLVAPTDARYAGYASGRGASLALKADALTPLTGTPFGLHPAFAPLKAAWDEGALGVVLNTGTLFQPLNRTLYQKSDLRPAHLMSHASQVAEWQGMRTRERSLDGFLGRIADRMGSTSFTPPLISVAGTSLAVIGSETTPLVLPSTGPLVRTGYDPTSNTRSVIWRQEALAAMDDVSAYGPVTGLTAQAMSTAYARADEANTVISAATSVVDAHFKNPKTGKFLTSDIARQLARVARMIEARDRLGHPKQAFFVSQGGYDTHSGQVDANNTATGRQADLFVDLALALAGFYNAMGALGLQKNVTAFTMSDFGRTFKVNAQRGTDHAWGSNHLVLGGGLRPQTVHGRYPDLVFGGAEDADSNGRWIPSIAVEEYIGAIAQWYGVAPADMPYVFPNWATWNGGGRGPVPLFA